MLLISKLFAAARYANIGDYCVTSDPSPNDGEDNDCDGMIDEELPNGVDDDGDGLIGKVKVMSMEAFRR